jgi:hypothetical protein
VGGLFGLEVQNLDMPFTLVPQMPYAVIYVAWIAMMLQLMHQQKSFVDIFDWAMLALLPGCHLGLRGR